MDEKKLKTILNSCGPLALGYYVALKLEGPLPLGDIARRLRLDARICAQIESDLIRLGMIRTVGRGVHRKIIDDTEKEVEVLLDHFADARGMDGSIPEWRTRQTPAAREVIQRYGIDASKWMTTYIVKVKNLDMFSLRLIHSMAAELLPIYEKQKHAKTNIKDVEWDAPEERALPKEEIEPNEVKSLLSFDIDI